MIALLLLLAALPGSVRAQSTRIDELQDKIQRIQIRISDLERDRQRKLQENEDLGRRIEQLKLRLEQDSGFFNKQRLDELLNRQRRLSRELSTVESRLAAYDSDLQRTRDALRKEYTIELNRLAEQIDAEQDRGRRAEQLASYFDLRQAKSRVPASSHSTEIDPQVPIQLTIDPLDSVDDLLEKAAILRDTRRRVRARIRQVERLIAELEQDRQMDLEMWETIERERFFEDGGVIQTFGQRSPPKLEQYDQQIEALKSELPRLKSIADELARRAEQFEIEAANRRKGGNVQ
ncbi:MAG: hypothetical protein P9M14_05580 [Candidatus Alcyoniella australis]|nr:hypothetical protein [Candidatus Alcyoniella australis]